MKRNIIKPKVIIFLLLLCFFGCKEDKNNGYIPNAYVNMYIFLGDPEFVALNSVGNSVIVTGGVKGIILHRLSFEEFVAIERVSSYQPENLCAVNIDSTGMFLVDPCSGSKFIITDGSVVKGPAQLPLKCYTTEYDPMNNSLHVYN